VLDVAAILGADCGYGYGGVSVFLGNGDGTFQSARTSSPGGGLFIATGDFNRDGKLDLAVVTADEGLNGLIAILLGNGDGTFQKEIDYAPPVWQGPYTILDSATLAVSDYNRDGKLDIAFSGAKTGGLLQGNGDGTFTFVNPVYGPFGLPIFAADLNGDGKLDLVEVPCYTFFGNGDGTFQHAIQSGGPEYCWGGNILGDVNGDGLPDLTDTLFQGLIQFALGNGDGTFQNPDGLGGFAAPGAVATGDFNRDGMVDVAVLSTNPDLLTIWLQNLFPVLYTFPGFLNFNLQPVGETSPAQTVRLTNNDTVTVTISSIYIDANPPVFAETNDCGPTLAVKASCFVQVTFSPATQGTFTGTLFVPNSSSQAGAQVPLTGITPIPEATLVPSNLTFPNQPTGSKSASQNVTLKNPGTGTLIISNISIGPSDFGMVNGCGGTLLVGASCTISVYFDPKSTGTINGALTVTDNAPNFPAQQTAPLSGTGILSDFELIPTSSTTVTVTPGQAANYSLALTPLNKFSQTVQLSCSGVPAQSTCTIKPSAVTLNGSTAASIAVAVVTTDSSGGLTTSLKDIGGQGFTGAAWFLLAAIGLTALYCLSLTRHRLGNWVITGVLALCVVCATSITPGCGGSGGGSSATPQGTYTITVTGTFGAGSSQLVHSTKLRLIVQ
jgi:hypothetical protein